MGLDISIYKCNNQYYDVINLIEKLNNENLKNDIQHCLCSKEIYYTSNFDDVWVFVDYIKNNLSFDDCFTIFKKEDLEELFNKCEKILKDKSLAKKLLPISDFRKNQYQYNEKYFNCLKNILEISNKLHYDEIYMFFIC